MTDVSDILSRAEAALAEFDVAQRHFALAQAKVNTLCREFSIATKTYAFRDYMLRKEVAANQRRGSA